MPLARLPPARAVTPISLALVMSAAASCVPNNELATYRSGEAGGVDAVGGAAATGEDADVGTSDAELPLSLPDAAPPPMRNDAAAVSACAADELTGPNGRCHLLVATRLDWGAARSACQARGTGWDLVSVRTAADSAFLGDILTFEGLARRFGRRDRRHLALGRQ